MAVSSSEPSPAEPNHSESPGSRPIDGAAGSADLSRTAELIGQHRFIERRLFALTGEWSTDPGPGSADAAAAVFLATQSELHAWRLAQWESRSPRSITTLEEPPEGWADALATANGSGSITTRLACWATVLAPQLASRYLRHRQHCTGPADNGTRRWLRIATDDVLCGVAEAGLLLSSMGSGSSVAAGAAVGATLDALVMNPSDH